MAWTTSAVVRLVTDAAGAVANRYDYDAFGNLEATSYETVANPFGFTARERDAESGLMFYRARYYDPKIGRFISEDPIGFEAADGNFYRYVSNAPIFLRDPLGLSPIGMTALQTCAVGAFAGALAVGLAQDMGRHYGRVAASLDFVIAILEQREVSVPEFMDAATPIVLGAAAGCGMGAFGASGIGAYLIMAGAASFTAGFATGWSLMEHQLPSPK